MKTSSLCRLTLVLAFGLSLCISSGADADLVGAWLFDEGQGEIAHDSSDNQIHGTLVGASWTDGMFGTGALDLESNQYVDFPQPAPAPLMLERDLSIMAWVYPKAWIGGHNCVFSMQSGTTGAEVYGIYFGNAGGTEVVFYSTSGGKFTSGVGTIGLEEWTHTAVTYDGTEVVFYINGVRVAGRAHTAALDHRDGTGRFAIGANYNNTTAGEFCSARVDELLIYDEALPIEIIQDLGQLGFLAGQANLSKARSPSPTDGAVGVIIPLLQWAAGGDAMLHRVYLGTTPDLGPDNIVNPMQPMTMFFVMQPLQPGTTYYWRIDEIEADMTTVHTGNVWSFTTQALTAYHPTPADAATNVSLSPELTWFAGQNAIKHQVYFSTSFDDVNEAAAAADKGVLTAKTTFAPGDLGSLSTYYWRVDEILFDNTVRAGAVWSFATYRVVEDFESYTDDEGSRIYEAWIDGWVNGTGSTVGYVEAPFAEQTIVHGGAQSMPLDYNNVNSPFYSEAEYEWSAAQDWTADGIGALVVHIRGQLSNAVAPLYIAIEDTSQSSSMVLHPDAEIVKKTKWVEWKIPLTEFAGVNLARVKKMMISVGDRETPAIGGSGLVYIDDVRVTKP